MQLEDDLSRLVEENAQLNSEKEAANRSAAEIVDQKMVEIRSLNEQLLKILEGEFDRDSSYNAAVGSITIYTDYTALDCFCR